MGLTKDQKSEIIKKHGNSEQDTGNVAVQISLLTTRIKQLTEHAKIHKKDHHSRRGLLKLVGQRRHLLDYMIRTDLEGYRSLIKKLGIRR